MSPKKAVKQYGKEAVDACAKEMRSLLFDKKTMSPVHKTNLNRS